MGDLISERIEELRFIDTLQKMRNQFKSNDELLVI